MINDYFKVLGITENATISEVKKAYRNKAKLLHPDINPSDDAHEQFILVNEAYEYLTQKKSGNKSFSKNAATEYSYGFDFNQDWEEFEREAARQRAREYAKMDFEAFKKTRQYKSAMALNALVDAIGIGIVIIIFSSPVIGFYTHGSWGILAGALIIFVTVHYWVDIIRQHKQRLKHSD